MFNDVIGVSEGVMEVANCGFMLKTFLF